MLDLSLIHICAHVVGDDAEGLGHFLVFAVGLAAQFADPGKDAGKDIRLVDGLRAHQHAVGALLSLIHIFCPGSGSKLKLR